MNLRIAGIIPESFSDGPGIRYTIFFQGCTHHCLNCHNKHTWAFDRGEEYSVKELITLYKNNYPRLNITLSGGDPFDQNLTLLLQFLREIKSIPDKEINIWAYTGYTYEQLYEKLEQEQKLEIFKYINILVDGPYIDSLKDLDLDFRGSSNQRIIDLQATLQTGCLTLYKVGE